MSCPNTCSGIYELGFWCHDDPCQLGTGSGAFACECEIKPGALAGIIVGSILGFMVLVALLVLCCVCWAKKRRDQQASHPQQVQQANQHYTPYAYGQQQEMQQQQTATGVPIAYNPNAAPYGAPPPANNNGTAASPYGSPYPQYAPVPQQQQQQGQPQYGYNPNPSPPTQQQPYAANPHYLAYNQNQQPYGTGPNQQPAGYYGQPNAAPYISSPPPPPPPPQQQQQSSPYGNGYPYASGYEPNPEGTVSSSPYGHPDGKGAAPGV